MNLQSSGKAATFGGVRWGRGSGHKELKVVKQQLILSEYKRDYDKGIIGGKPASGAVAQTKTPNWVPKVKRGNSDPLA